MMQRNIIINFLYTFPIRLSQKMLFTFTYYLLVNLTFEKNQQFIILFQLQQKTKKEL
jgi:hypothetical protein